MTAPVGATARAAVAFLSAGAAQGLVQALRPEFEAASGSGGTLLQGRFGAVGAMKEALLAGEEPCDLFISTHKMVQELVAEGRLRAGSEAPLGRVHTGLAVRNGEPLPRCDSVESLRAVLAAATALYFPDPERATAGIHFARVLAELGLADETRPRWRTYPNGATAMREMGAPGPAGATGASGAIGATGAIGCTQVSEILIAPGVTLVGVLPQKFELATLYTAAVARDARQPEAAARFIALLTAAGQQGVRARCGLVEP